VPELKPQAVSVLDQTGALLSQLPGETAAGLDASQLQYVRQAEQGLSQRILAILEPIVGAGNVKAQVTADIDFTQSESTAEVYSPNQGQAPATVRSQHLSEVPGAAGQAAGGSPGALSNQAPTTQASPINGPPQALPASGGAAVAAGGVKRDALTNYEVDKTVKVVRNASGAIRRLSAAVIVNHASVVGADGKAVVKPLPAEQMDQINALVREAIGFSKERGDSVQVVNAPFTVPVVAPAGELPIWRQPEVLDTARSLGPWLGLPVLALIIILGLVRPAVKAARVARPRRLDATVQDAIALGETEILPGTSSAPPRLPTAQAAKLTSRDAQLENIRQLARQNPATIANVVRDWSSQPS
jgi:flagellar M-ring protein FliF